MSPLKVARTLEGLSAVVLAPAGPKTFDVHVPGCVHLGKVHLVDQHQVLATPLALWVQENSCHPALQTE